MLAGIDVNGVLAAGDSFGLGEIVGRNSGSGKHTKGQEGGDGLEGNHFANWAGGGIK